MTGTLCGPSATMAGRWVVSFSLHQECLNTFLFQGLRGFGSETRVPDTNSAHLWDTSPTPTASGEWTYSSAVTRDHTYVALGSEVSINFIAHESLVGSLSTANS